MLSLRFLWTGVSLRRGLLPTSSSNRLISTTSLNFVKKIVIKEDGDNISVEGVPYESERKPYVVKLPEDADPEKQNATELDDTSFGRFLFQQKHKYCGSCPFCKLNLKRLNYSDTLILQQFIHSDGTLLFREDTGLCRRSWHRVKECVLNAQKANLLPRPPTFQSYGPWDDLGRYYERPRRHRDVPMRIIRKEYWDDGMKEYP